MIGVFNNRREELFNLQKMRQKKIAGNGENATSGMETCPECKKQMPRILFKNNLYVCSECGHHISISAKERVRQLADSGSFVSQHASFATTNPITFPEYEHKLEKEQHKTGINDAIITGTALIDGRKVELIVLDSKFMMGSMGTVVGEKFTLAIEHAMKHKLPVIAVCSSGGARMQEGMFSLMQMAKTSMIVEKFSEKKGLYISVLTHPTMGGVSASFAMLGDIIIAEPKALIGFAGQRVIEQTIGQKLPEGFQRAAFLEEHGFVDMVVERARLKDTISNLLKLHGVPKSGKLEKRRHI